MRPDRSLPGHGGRIQGHRPRRRQDVPVLITGESGTGKNLVARAVYRTAPERKRPFLALDSPPSRRPYSKASCSVMRRAGFTGADRRRIGKFEQCNGGTIFLDEIGDMSLATAGQGPALLAEKTLGARRRQRDDPHRRPRDRRHPPRPAAWCAEGRFRARPVLPASRVHDSLSAPAPAKRRPADAGDSLGALASVKSWDRCAAACSGGARAAPAWLLLAGQRPRASKRTRTGVSTHGAALLPAFLPKPLGSYGKCPGRGGGRD